MVGAFLFSLLPGFLKVAILRSRGVEVGRGVRLGFLTIIRGRIRSIGDSVSLGPLVYLNCDEMTFHRGAQVRPFTLIRVGKLVLKEFCKIGSLNLITGKERFFPHSEFIVGSNSYIAPLCFIECGQRVAVGDDVGMGNAYIFTHGSWLSYLEGYPFQVGGVEIGDRVQMAWRVFVMPGTKVGDDVVVGAKALLRGEYPDNSLAAGIPAKVVRQPLLQPMDDQERLRRFLEVLETLKSTAAEIGVPVEAPRFDAEGVEIVWKPGDRSEARLLWSPSGDAPSPGPGQIRIYLDDTVPPHGSFFNAKLRRYRIGRREADLGAVVKRVFSYYGVRAMPL